MEIQTCRLCMSQDNIIDVYDKALNGAQNLRHFLTLASGIKIDKTGLGSTHVCHKCCTIAIKAFKYRTNAINRDKALKDEAGQSYKEEDYAMDASQVEQEIIDLEAEDEPQIEMAKERQKPGKKPKPKSALESSTAKRGRGRPKSSSPITTPSTTPVTVQNTSPGNMDLGLKIVNVVSLHDGMTPKRHYHKSVNRLLRNNMNLILPDEVLKFNVSPEVWLERNELEAYMKEKRRKEKVIVEKQRNKIDQDVLRLGNIVVKRVMQSETQARKPSKAPSETSEVSIFSNETVNKDSRLLQWLSDSCPQEKPAKKKRTMKSKNTSAPLSVKMGRLKKAKMKKMVGPLSVKIARIEKAEREKHQSKKHAESKNHRSDKSKIDQEKKRSVKIESDKYESVKRKKKRIEKIYSEIYSDTDESVVKQKTKKRIEKVDSDTDESVVKRKKKKRIEKIYSDTDESVVKRTKKRMEKIGSDTDESGDVKRKKKKPESSPESQPFLCFICHKKVDKMLFEHHRSQHPICLLCHKKCVDVKHLSIHLLKDCPYDITRNKPLVKLPRIDSVKSVIEKYSDAFVNANESSDDDYHHDLDPLELYIPAKIEQVNLPTSIGDFINEDVDESVLGIGNVDFWAPQDQEDIDPIETEVLKEPPPEKPEKKESPAKQEKVDILARNKKLRALLEESVSHEKMPPAKPTKGFVDLTDSLPTQSAPAKKKINFIVSENSASGSSSLTPEATSDSPQDDIVCISDDEEPTAKNKSKAKTTQAPKEIRPVVKMIGAEEFPMDLTSKDDVIKMLFCRYENKMKESTNIGIDRSKNYLISTKIMEEKRKFIFSNLRLQLPHKPILVFINNKNAMSVSYASKMSKALPIFSIGKTVSYWSLVIPITPSSVPSECLYIDDSDTEQAVEKAKATSAPEVPRKVVEIQPAVITKGQEAAAPEKEKPVSPKKTTTAISISNSVTTVAIAKPASTLQTILTAPMNTSNIIQTTQTNSPSTSTQNVAFSNMLQVNKLAPLLIMPQAVGSLPFQMPQLQFLTGLPTGSNIMLVPVPDSSRMVQPTTTVASESSVRIEEIP